MRMIILHPNDYPDFFEELRARGRVIAVSGYFDPPTPTHLIYFRAAKELGSILVVMLNTDEQLLLKRKGTPLEGRIRYPFKDRAFILNEIRTTDVVVQSIDTGRGIAETLRAVRPHIFAKGGDRDITNIPQEEIDVCKEIRCEIVGGVGGGRNDKTHSSSWYDWEDTLEITKHCDKCGNTAIIKPVAATLEYVAYGSNRDFCTKCEEPW
jgi:D-beta-D-heptose 7-phosphate kinase/D-beta-D-heptose 1-phosphate adenosyltransferase